MQREKKIAFCKYRRTKLIEDKIVYRNLDRSIKARLRQLTRKKEEKILQTGKTKTFYNNFVKSKFVCKGKLPVLIQNDGALIENDESKAFTFLNHFATLFTDADHLPPPLGTRISDTELSSISFFPEEVYAVLQSFTEAAKNCTQGGD